jgi:CheY-like chemotaxis protein
VELKIKLKVINLDVFKMNKLNDEPSPATNDPKLLAPILDPKLDPNLTNKPTLEILLAEDNLVNQKVATHLCRRLGYTVDLAENGLEVLMKLKQKRYDVILMDIEMPKMDGIETTRRIITELPISERPYIIAVTANNVTASRERCLGAGMDEYLNKPLRLDRLTELLDKLKNSTPQP